MHPTEEINFLVKKMVVFICEKCGDTIQMNVPANGTTNTRSYCCSATYAVVEMEGGIHLARMADRDSGKAEVAREAAMNAVPVGYNG